MEVVSSNLSKIVADVDRAEDIRTRLRPHLEAAAKVMDEARIAGLLVSFQLGYQINANNGIAGKTGVQSIAVTRPL